MRVVTGRAAEDMLRIAGCAAASEAASYYDYTTVHGAVVIRKYDRRCVFIAQHGSNTIALEGTPGELEALTALTESDIDEIKEMITCTKTNLCLS